MPELARFFGIIIRMYAEAGGRHHLPHFHAYYQDSVAVYGIDEIELLGGSLPRRQSRLVEAWAELRRDELQTAWQSLQQGIHLLRSIRFVRRRSMRHPIYRVITVEVLEGYALRVGFDDGIQREIDLEPVLAGEIYGPLRDRTLFQKVAVDSEVHTLVWPNGADFDPATLHDWPEHEEAMGGLARRWALAEAV